VESAVLIGQRRILAALRDAVFFSLADLNAAITRLLGEINTEPFQKREGTRQQLFQRYDRPAARTLPDRPYEYGQWRKALVHRDHHIEVARGYYSVHYSLVGERVEARLSVHTVEIFRHGKLIAAHPRVQRPYQRRTIEAHRPPEHRAYLALGFDQLLEQAQRIGPNTAAILTKQALQKKHLGETILNAQGILRLAQDFSPKALEQAAEAAMQLAVYNYRALRDLLRRGAATATTPPPAAAAAYTTASLFPAEHQNVRGEKYFH
jgi:hypothetical protein